MTQQPSRLVRWNRRTMRRTTQALIPVAVACCRCGGMIPLHLAERDYERGDFRHAGNCPWAQMRERQRGQEGGVRAA